MKFFIPSWNGDVRLEPLDDGKAVQVIAHDPTASEQAGLAKLLDYCRGKGWTSLTEVPKPKKGRWRKSEFRVDGPAAQVCAEAARLFRPAKSAITALRISGGEVHVTEVAETAAVVEKAVEVEKQGETAVAATTKRPTMCCPACVPGSIGPASEVLLSFLTTQQHRDWARHRVVEVEGGTTGHRYLVAHRHSPHAVKWGRICWDADDRGVLHFHDLSHPPEEEVLGAILLLAHRESWVRNEASCFAGSFRHVLKNPFGDVGDGTKDAALMQVFGGIASALAVQSGAADEGTRRLVRDAVESDLARLEPLFEGRGRPRRILL